MSDRPPRLATRDDFTEILGALPAFWSGRDVAHLHHPMAIEEFGDGALVIDDRDGRVVAYLFGMVLADRRLAYVHVVAVREDRRGLGHARRLYAAFSELASVRGCTRCKAITPPANAGSIAFHESLGMHGTLVADYSGPGRDRVVLTAALPLASVGPPGSRKNP